MNLHYPRALPRYEDGAPVLIIDIHLMSIDLPLGLPDRQCFRSSSVCCKKSVNCDLIVVKPECQILARTEKQSGKKSLTTKSEYLWKKMGSREIRENVENVLSVFWARMTGTK